MQNTIITIPVPEYVKNDHGQHVENNAVKVLENIKKTLWRTLFNTGITC
jgi:hypothetical protein